MKKRRREEFAPRRIEQPPHDHTDDCKLTTYEGRQLVVYRGRRSVIDWLNRVADLARERTGEAPMTHGAIGSSPVRSPSFSVGHGPLTVEAPPASDTTRHDPAATSL